jgi:quercetin dioxygenase-like cupin family protein
MNFSELIKHQPGQISSRLLWEGGLSDGFIFAMDKGETISPERAEATRWFYVLEGTLRIIGSTSAVTLGKGEAWIIPAYQEHELQGVENCKYVQISVISATAMITI